MSLELREWRALAIGWALAIFYAAVAGIDWGVPLVAIGTAMIAWAVWTD